MPCRRGSSKKRVAPEDRGRSSHERDRCPVQNLRGSARRRVLRCLTRYGAALFVVQRFDWIQAGGADGGIQPEHEADGDRHDEREDD